MGDKKPMERFYDALAGNYVRRKEQSVSARLALRILLDTALDLPLGAGPWRILDAGGGGGLYAAELARAGHEVTLVDLSQPMLEEAAKHVASLGVADRVSLVRADVCDLSRLGERRFDLVVSVGDVLSYCGDPQQALREFGRLTRPGGMLLVEVESRFGGIRSGRRGRTLDEIYRTWMDGHAAPPDWDDVRIRLYHPAEFRLLLQQAQWRTVQQWSSHICWALLGTRRLQAFGSTAEGFEKLLTMERYLRGIPGLLAAGGDLVFLAAR